MAATSADCALWLRRASEHVQAVADRKLLDVAKLGVELGDGLARRLAAHEPAVGGEARRQARSTISASSNGMRRRSRPSAAAYSSISASSSAMRRAAAGAQRRRQMADRDGAKPALGLHRLARIVDDEGIDHRQRPSTASGQHSDDSASALPGSHSSVPCVPRWISASMLSLSRSQRIERDIGVPRRAGLS